MTEKRDNPYTVPQAGLETPFSAGSEIELASIGQRIGARCIDFGLWLFCFFIVFAVILVVMLISRLSTLDSEEENPLEDTNFEENFDLNYPFFGGYWEDSLIHVHNSGTYVGLAIGQAIFLLLQAYFLAKYGQTIGKRHQNIVIIDRVTHEKLPFTQLYLKRYLVFEAFGVVSWILDLIFRIVDFVFLFRDDRRTIHDMVANTIVVRQSSR